MTDNISKFPQKLNRKLVTAAQVEMLGFSTKDDRKLYVDDPADIQKIMNFMAKSGIKITIGE